MTQPQKVVRVKFYFVVIGILTAVLSPVASIWASVQIAEGNAKQVIEEQQAAQAKAESAAKTEAKRLTCSYFALDLDTYLEVPPSTPTGKAKQENVLEFYRITGCQPPRTK